MNNLEQTRAACALNDAKALDRTAVSKLPTLILNNGLLATAAFCCGDNSRGDMKTALEKTARFLFDQKKVEPDPNSKSSSDRVKDLIDALSKGSSYQLQQATAEALAYLGYLKRFSQPKSPKTTQG